MAESEEQLVARWQTAWEAPASGWDFTEFEGRVQAASPPWSWHDLAIEAVGGATSVLDLGTGGGEALIELGEALPDGLPADTHATEGWAPNLPVARAALASYGIEVAPYDAEAGDRLPYPDAGFDVVLSRHEAYDGAEVARVLRPPGTFLTQQVDGRNLDDLAQLFGFEPAYPHVRLEVFAPAARAAGLDVDLALDWAGPISFVDVTALVSYLRLMPWQLPQDFNVARYAETLLGLHAAASSPVFTERRFVLRGRLAG